MPIILENSPIKQNWTILKRNVLLKIEDLQGFAANFFLPSVAPFS